MFSKQTQNVIRSIREIKTPPNAIYINRMKCIEGNYLRCFRGSGSLCKKHILLNPDEPRFFAASYAWSFLSLLLTFLEFLKSKIGVDIGCYLFQMFC